MKRIASIVEGDGEVSALPILLRRLNEWLTPEIYVEPLPPIRVHRDRFLNRDEEFSRHLLLAAAKCGKEGCILILLDADDFCPFKSGPEIFARAQSVVPHRKVSVVLANREYEAWFIASADSLDGHRGFTYNRSRRPPDPEIPRDCKGWMKSQMSGGAYRETTDQAAFTARMDLEQAHNLSRSFQKLCREWKRQFAPSHPN